LVKVVVYVNAVGAVMVNVTVPVHPLPSLTVAVYVPATRFVNEFEAWNAVGGVGPARSIEYVIGAVPPEAPSNTEPFTPPKQLTLDTEITEATGPGDAPTTILDTVTVHPLASVTTTLYVPAARPVNTFEA
jgi:hypothetical protein